MSKFHTPVMPNEAIQYLDVKKDGWYVDCNLGGGGHTDLILKAGGKVIGIDLDQEAIAEVTKNHQLEIEQGRLILYQSNFSETASLVSKASIGKVNGVLFDLGVSTHQLEKEERGFSFNTDASLDMRMNQKSEQPTAVDLVNGLRVDELSELFWKLGEERFAKPIARKIVEARLVEKITTTNQLASIILSVRRRSDKDRTHPATRVFQALRIAVNDELNSLRLALPQALSVITPNGRLVVLTFHSLEDRIVKNFMRDEAKKASITIITRKPLIPSLQEVKNNPRSRSGKLRVAEKKRLVGSL